MRSRRSLLGSLFLLSLFLLARPAFAQTDVETGYQSIQDQGIIFANICASKTATCDCRDTGKCTLTDVEQLFVNIGVFILGISGSIALLIFVYGGFEWVTSLGRPDRIEKGKNAMIGAVIGLAFIFGAYIAISALTNVLKLGFL